MLCVFFQCVVIGLQSTGEARTLEQLEESGGELSDFVSTAMFVIFYFLFTKLVAHNHPGSAGITSCNVVSQSLNIFSTWIKVFYIVYVMYLK